MYLYVSTDSIPTLTEWGIIIFMILMNGIRVVVIHEKGSIDIRKGIFSNERQVS